MWLPAFDEMLSTSTISLFGIDGVAGHREPADAIDATAGRRRARPGEVQVHESVGLEVGVERNTQQSALAAVAAGQAIVRAGVGSSTSLRIKRTDPDCTNTITVPSGIPTIPVDAPGVATGDIGEPGRQTGGR